MKGIHHEVVYCAGILVIIAFNEYIQHYTILHYNI